MNRKTTVIATVALGAALALAPIAAQTAMAAPVASHSVSAPAATAKVEAPVDRSSERDNNLRQLYFDIGQTTQNVSYTARPGALVTVVVNGSATTVVANAKGIATVPVAFERTDNRFEVFQTTVKGVESVHATYGFLIS